ncbi:MAG: response regulator [Acidobacteriota bacterium]
METGPSRTPIFVFDIWGCRGSRNLEPGSSRLGTRTPCYSVLGREELLVFDAGRGLAALGIAMKQGVRYQNVSHIHLLVSHAHMDHWEGLKDVDWFWLKDRPLEVTLHGPSEAVEAARAAFAHPSYVPLEQLASGTNVRFDVDALKAGDERDLGSFRLKTAALNHYSGSGPTKRMLDALGFRAEGKDGPVVSYVSDHEPSPSHAADEARLVTGASLIVLDAHYANISEHSYGHGSIEYAARIARSYPDTLVMASHIGSLLSDESIIESVLRHAQGVANFRLSREGDSYFWNWREQKFITHGQPPAVSVGSDGTPRRPFPKGGLATPEDLHILRHELKTPINQIMGYSELIEEEMEDKGESSYTADLRKIHKASQQLLYLVDQIQLPDSAPGAPPPVPQHSTGLEQATAEIGTDDEAAVALPADYDQNGAPGEHVLVVDDNELNLDMLSRRLKGRGYRVSVASDGQQAFEKVNADRFDAILLDIMMPGISGLDVLKALRKTYTPADLPVIMATARDQSEDIVEALKLGANDYVTKPLDFPVVVARLRTHLSLKKARDRVNRLVEGLEVRNRFIRKTFGRYLSDDVVASLLESPEGLKLGGDRRVVTMLMADLRGFTSMTHGMNPELVMRVLNNYLGTMAHVITKHRGTIDEFLGDGILALFGAPIQAEDDPRRALACALEMQVAIEAVNEHNAAEGLPSIDMGVALNTGEVVVGNIGSETRAKYGVVGSQVNLSGRIESFTVGGQILMTDATLQAAGRDVHVGKALALNAKGFKEPVRVYELVGLGAPYNIFLPQRKDAPVQLSQEIPVLCWVLSDKLIDTDVFEGFITALSPRGGEMRSLASLEPMTNLKLRFAGDREKVLDSDIYVKVTCADETAHERLSFRFTSARPDVLEYIRQLRENNGRLPGEPAR